MIKTKKDIILEAALNLFAENGYTATPTSLIAKKAGVSEGLIFKHYISKENLLDIVVKTGYRRVMETSKGLVLEDDPQKLIANVLDMPLILVEEDRAFWRMQFKLANEEIAQKHHMRYAQSIMKNLVEAFTKLGYQEPELEAEFLLLTVEGLWRLFSMEGDKDKFIKLLSLIKSKYEVV
ncbi:helix-turn-helix transcriptional regulator [Pontibacter sp. 172403-2]|uniref:TetR/AcrR family transcriptional regulator n=1 Tax=Pontibacter rufus TaxID=2791028 RepID=UPI0018AF7DC2|nr:TetR/AcrR family transcriptional regulator [Pontibacter sp. 172403-2]MBF9254248.1 helix-turn-helix transcriptional regulator [Pontibacter sp. 172403-2]